MRQLFGRPVFSAGEVEYVWEDVLLASVLRGDWRDLEQLVREELACARFLRESGDEPPRDAVDEAAAEFRYDRNLVSAAETYAWLGRWGLEAGEWMAWIRRALARKRAASRRAQALAECAPSADECAAALPVTLVCAGLASRFLQAAAERAAALRAVGTPDESSVHAMLAHVPADLAERGFGELSASRLAERARVAARLEVAIERFRERALTPKTLHHEVDGRHLDWIRVDYSSASFPTEGMAREAVLCVRDDGLELGDVAAEAGTQVVRARRWLEEVDRELRERLLAGRAGDLLGPVRENGGFLVHRIEAKRLPSLDDLDVRRRAEDSALRHALAAAVNDSVRWEVAP